MNNNNNNINSNDNSTTTATTQQQTLRNIDIFNLNEVDNNNHKYCYYYETNDQQNDNYNNNNDLFFASASTTTDDDNLESNKLVSKYEWLKFKTNLTNNDVKQNQGYDFITINCSYCSIYYNCDRILIKKFEQYLNQTESVGLIDRNNIYYLLNQFLNHHEQTNEHKTAITSTYLSTHSNCDTSSTPSPSTSSLNQQQPDSTIIITNLDLNANSTTPQSSPSISSSFENNKNSSQPYLVLNNKLSPTSQLSCSSTGCFKDEEIESCLNTNDLVVNDNFLLESLSNNESYYSANTINTQEQLHKNSKKKQPTANGNDIQQYGSILKAINKRKLHISCPLCVSKVVNMSDHLVKKHSIKDRYQRKHLMDSVRRNYLANTNNNNSTCLNDFNNQNNNKRNSQSLNSMQNLLRQSSTSTPNKTRKLIKCPICTDDNKFFVNISDHLIKIHHLNTSEMRKPVLKSIKSWTKNVNNSNNQEKTFLMLVDQQQPTQNNNNNNNSLEKEIITPAQVMVATGATNSTNNNEILILNDNNQTTVDEANDYLIAMSDQFEQQQQHKAIEQVSPGVEREEQTNAEIEAYINHKYQQIKKNDLRKSILKRYSKQIRKVKANINFLNQYNRNKKHLEEENDHQNETATNSSQLKTVSEQQHNMYNLMKLENNVNTVNNKLNNIIELNQSNSSNQYFSSSSIIINPQQQQNNNCLIFHQNNDTNDNISNSSQEKVI